MRKPNKRDQYSPIKKGNGGNPFETYDARHNQSPNKPFEMVASSAVASVEDENQRRAHSGREAQAVSLPKHLFIPEDAQSMILRATEEVAAGATEQVMSFTAPAGATTFFQFYVISTTPNVNATGSFFAVFVNGIRALPFHGNPNNRFRMDVFSFSDGFNNTPNQCLLQLQPKDVLTWTFTNLTGAPVFASVGMAGYVDMSTERINGRTGG